MGEGVQAYWVEDELHVTVGRGSVRVAEVEAYTAPDSVLMTVRAWGAQSGQKNSTLRVKIEGPGASTDVCRGIYERIQRCMVSLPDGRVFPTDEMISCVMEVNGELVDVHSEAGDVPGGVRRNIRMSGLCSFEEYVVGRRLELATGESPDIMGRHSSGFCRRIDGEMRVFGYENPNEKYIAGYPLELLEIEEARQMIRHGLAAVHPTDTRQIVALIRGFRWHTTNLMAQLSMIPDDNIWLYECDGLPPDTQKEVACEQ